MTLSTAYPTAPCIPELALVAFILSCFISSLSSRWTCGKIVAAGGGLGAGGGTEKMEAFSVEIAFPETDLCFGYGEWLYCEHGSWPLLWNGLSP